MKIPVYIEITKGISEIHSYRGLMDKEVHSSIIEGRCSREFIQLEQAQWTEELWDAAKEKAVHHIRSVGTTPPYENHTGEIWFRLSHIAVIQMMNELPSCKSPAP